MACDAPEAAFSREAEMAALGSMVLSEEALAAGLSGLSEDDFHLVQNRAVYRALASGPSGGKMDAVVLTGLLGKAGTLDEVGGVDYVGALVGTVPVAANYNDYFAILKSKSRVREARSVGLMLAHAEEGSIGEVSAEVLRRLGAARGGKPSLLAASDLSAQAIASIRGRLEAGYKLIWGYRCLDEAMGGMRAGETTVIGARTSQGKTSFALNVVWNNIRRGASVLYVAYENPDQLMPRLAAIADALPLWHYIMPSAADPKDVARFEAAVHRVGQETRLTVLARASVPRVRAELALAQRDIVVCDYIQRASIEHHETENRHVSVSRAFHEWYNVAADCGCAVLVLSQISRRQGADFRGNPKKPRPPSLDELKESGDLENFSDNVLLLWWKWRETLDEQHDPRRYQVEIAKLKMGKPGRAIIDLDPETLRMTGA